MFFHSCRWCPNRRDGLDVLHERDKPTPGVAVSHLSKAAALRSCQIYLHSNLRNAIEIGRRGRVPFWGQSEVTHGAVAAVPVTATVDAKIRLYHHNCVACHLAGLARVTPR